jgi:hypothetical protein
MAPQLTANATLLRAHPRELLQLTFQMISWRNMCSVSSRMWRGKYESRHVDDSYSDDFATGGQWDVILQLKQDN